MPVTIAASSSTHFLWNGNPMPRVYSVVPHGALDARLESVDDRTWMLVPLGSAVSGSEPANRDALVAALAGIVSPAVGGGGGGGVDPGAVGLAVNAALKGSPQPIEGQVALPSDVVNAIGSAVNEAIRGGGALPSPAAPPTNPIDVTVTNTWAALPSTACTRFELLNERWPTDEIPIRYRRGGAGAARVQPAGKADTVDVAANANEIQVSRADGVAGNIVVQLQVLA